MKNSEDIENTKDLDESEQKAELEEKLSQATTRLNSLTQLEALRTTENYRYQRLANQEKTNELLSAISLSLKSTNSLIKQYLKYLDNKYLKDHKDEQ